MEKAKKITRKKQNKITWKKQKKKNYMEKAKKITWKKLKKHYMEKAKKNYMEKAKKITWKKQKCQFGIVFFHGCCYLRCYSGKLRKVNGTDWMLILSSFSAYRLSCFIRIIASFILMIYLYPNEEVDKLYELICRREGVYHFTWKKQNFTWKKQKILHGKSNA